MHRPGMARAGREADGREYTYHALEVVQAPEPGDVLWENLEHGRGNVMRRRVVSNGILLAVLAVSFLLIYLCQTTQQRALALLTPSVPCDEIAAAHYGTYSGVPDNAQPFALGAGT